MSLKSFHIFFIVVSILLAFGFGAWSLQSHGAGHDGVIVVFGAVSLVLGVALVVYLAAFVRKVRRLPKA